MARSTEFGVLLLILHLNVNRTALAPVFAISDNLLAQGSGEKAIPAFTPLMTKVSPQGSKSKEPLVLNVFSTAFVSIEKRDNDKMKNCKGVILMIGLFENII